MYRLAIAIEEPERLRALVSQFETCIQACMFDLVCAGPVSELDAQIEAAGGIDVLIIDTALGSDGQPLGIEFVRRRFPVGCGTQVIYISSHAEHATRAYRTQHVYLIMEPVRPEVLGDALDRAMQNLRVAANRPIGVRTDGKIRVIFPHKISYIESDRRKLHIHTGDEVLTTYATLDLLEHDLPGSFVRSHKSFLVNMRFVESMDSAHICLFSGEMVPVSQKRRKATHDAFMAYMDNGI